MASLPIPLSKAPVKREMPAAAVACAAAATRPMPTLGPPPLIPVAALSAVAPIRRLTAADIAAEAEAAERRVSARPRRRTVAEDEAEEAEEDEDMENSDEEGDDCMDEAETDSREEGENAYEDEDEDYGDDDHAEELHRQNRRLHRRMASGKRRSHSDQRGMESEEESFMRRQQREYAREQASTLEHAERLARVNDNFAEVTPTDYDHAVHHEDPEAIAMDNLPRSARHPPDPVASEATRRSTMEFAARLAAQHPPMPAPPAAAKSGKAGATADPAKLSFEHFGGAGSIQAIVAADQATASAKAAEERAQRRHEIRIREERLRDVGHKG